MLCFDLRIFLGCGCELVLKGARRVRIGRKAFSEGFCVRMLRPRVDEWHWRYWTGIRLTKRKTWFLGVGFQQDPQCGIHASGVWFIPSIHSFNVTVFARFLERGGHKSQNPTGYCNAQKVFLMLYESTLRECAPYIRGASMTSLC